MDDKKDFLVLRYSLVEEPQHSLTMQLLPPIKGHAALSALEGDREFQLNGVRYGFLGFSAVEPTPSTSIERRRYFIGKIARLKLAHVGKKIPGDILETQEDDWIPLLAIFDVTGQYIFVRKDYRFGTPEQTMRALQAGLREPVMATFNHRAFVEACTRKEKFWEVVAEHRRFYKLELRLISPNILETNLRARDALAAMKDLFHQDQVTITLNSESGDLVVPKTPVADYLEYIEEGEGAWALTTEGLHGGKKTYSSSDNIDTVQVSLVEERTSPEAQQLDISGMPSNQISCNSDAEIVEEILRKASGIK